MDRRLQNLQRFLLEQLHRELSGSQGTGCHVFPHVMQCLFVLSGCTAQPRLDLTLPAYPSKAMVH